MKGIKLFIIAIMFSASALAQVGISSGLSALKGFGPNRPWGGFHIGVEVPRDDQASYYLRYTHHFPVRENDSIQLQLEPRDINNVPPGYQYYPIIGSLPSMNYNVFEFGTRYYIGDGYDFGWAGYGGTGFVLTFNRVRSNNAGYDEEVYVLPDYYNYEGTAFSLGFGLNGGIKYSVPPWGTVYFDVNISYILLYQQNTNNLYNSMIQPLTFGFNIGYRKDILW